MTARLPFTLSPLEGEPLELWLHAYAARLGVTTGGLVIALGLPAEPGFGFPLRPAVLSDRDAGSIRAATGLSEQAVTGMLRAPGHTPPPGLLAAWAPQAASRFCAACLTETPGHLNPDWRLRLKFFCLRHDRPLAGHCPHCHRGRPLEGRRAGTGSPAAAGHPTGCGHDPDAAEPPRCPDPPAAGRAQRFVDRLLTGLRDPGGTPASRQDALDTLIDVSLIAVHLATIANPRRGNRPLAGMLRADTLTGAVALLTSGDHASGPDPLALLAAEHGTGDLTRAIPQSWRHASPRLRTRIALARASTLTPVTRLRYATSLARARPLPARARASTDPAISRAARLPDQIWPAWAIRLTDTGQPNASLFTSSALIALLLPHSGLRLGTEIIPLVSGQVSADTVRNHMRMLTRGPRGDAALRILTELAFAIDASQIPIDYARRRRLAATTELISDYAWKEIARGHLAAGHGQHASHDRRSGQARRYLYELITGCNLLTAPAPYRPAGRAGHNGYRKFAAYLPAPVALALNDHARGLLSSAGITGEPLTWQPPASWVTATTWPGADPDQTDPEPIHAAILDQRLTVQAAAEAAGISVEHLRVVLHRHPLPRPVNPPRRWPHAIIAAHPDSGQPGRGPHAQAGDFFYIDPEWLREEYLTWQRSLPGIARQVGCHPAALAKFARARGIPLRPPGGSTRHITGTIPGHPSELPEPLRTALTGLKATERLERFLRITSQPSICQAASDLNISRSALGKQISILERACGGSIFLRPASNRRPLNELTPLGQQLRQQALSYLSSRRSRQRDDPAPAASEGNDNCDGIQTRQEPASDDNKPAPG